MMRVESKRDEPLFTSNRKLHLPPGSRVARPAILTLAL